jgi:hypothetical protein
MITFLEKKTHSLCWRFTYDIFAPFVGLGQSEKIFIGFLCCAFTYIIYFAQVKTHLPYEVRVIDHPFYRLSG